MWVSRVIARQVDLLGRLLPILILAFALWLAIETLDLRGPDPEVPRQVLTEPAEHERGGCAPYC